MTTVNNDDVETDFFSGDIPFHCVPKDEHYLTALDTILEKFRPPRKIRPVHFADLRLYPWKWKPSAEAPFADHARYLRILDTRYKQGIVPDRRPSFGNFKDIIFTTVRRQLHEIKEHKVNFDKYLYYFRTHAKPALVRIDEPNKVRMIFGSPKTFILAEAMFFWPLFNHYKCNSGSSPLLWGYETLNGGWLRLNAELFQSYLHRSILMIDWKRFDKYCLFSVIDDIFSGVRGYFDFTDDYIPTVTKPTHPNLRSDHADRLQRLWNWTCYARSNIPTLLPSGRLYRRLHAGVPSGLFTTNFLDSIYNGVMILTLISALGLEVNTNTFIKLMGDDSITSLPVLIPPNQHGDFIRALQAASDYYFGATISIEKSKMSNRPYGSEVLSYTNNNGFPIRDYNELLARLLFTKSKKIRPEQSMAMAIGIYYASAANCEYVRRVCKDVYDHYARQGYSPAKHGADYLFDPNLDIEIDYTHFPSPLEVQRALVDFPRRSNRLKEEYWPSWYFLDTA